MPYNNAVAGNNHLGGKDINEAIYNHFCYFLWRFFRKIAKNQKFCYLWTFLEAFGTKMIFAISAPEG